MVKQITQIKVIKHFKVGDIIVNPNVGLLNEVIEVRWNGMLIVRPLVWKDYYRDPLARESCVNSFYFKKATRQDFEEFQSRGIIEGHPYRCQEEKENYLNSNKLKKED